MLGAVLFLLSMTAVSPPSAHAYTPTSTQLDSIRDFIIRGHARPPGGGTVTCGPVCSDLWLSEHRPIPNQPASHALHRELWELRTKTKGLPKILPLLTRVSLVGTAGYALYEIGSSTWAKGVNFPVPPNDTVYALGSKAKNTTIVFESNPVAWPGDDLVTPNEDGFIGFFPNPEGGAETHWARHIWYTDGSQDTLPPCQESTNSAPVQSTSGMTRFMTTTLSQVTGCGSVDYSRYMFWTPLRFPTSDGAVVSPLTEGSVTENQTNPTFSQADWPLSQDTVTQIRTTIGNELANNPSQYPTLIPWLEHEFGEGPDPLAVPIPDCTGLAYNACITLLQDAGFGVFIRDNLSFEEAEPIPEGQPNQVVSQSPAAGTETSDTSQPITLTANPEDDDMPRTVPAPLSAEESASGQGETQAEWEARITAAPYNFTLGDAQVLSDTSLDPDFGPDSVVGSSPQPGARAHKGDPISPRVNPPTAPLVGGGGGCTPWVQPSINFAPLQGLGLLTVFPFAVPFWVFDAMDAWVGEPVTPSWDFHFPFAGEGDNWTVDLQMFDPHMPAIRAVLFAASLIAMAWFFLSLAMGSPTNRQQGAE